MTQYNKATLKTYFQQNDVPTGTDYANFIDSYVNQVETSEQAMAGALNTTELIAARVSAGNINCTGSFSVSGTFSPAAINTVTLSAANGNFTSGITSVSANFPNGIIQGTGIVSAAGSAQTTAAPLNFIINRLQGITDGQTTGFSIPSNITGKTLYIVNETAVSGNLWPPVGGKINAGSTNAVFPLAGNTSYTIFAVAASAYGVK